MFKSNHLRSEVAWVLCILVLSVGIVIAGEVVLLDTSALAGSGTCTPDHVMTYPDRVHVHCSAAISGIYYFAVSTADPAQAARVLNVITAAQAMGRTVLLQFDDDSGHNPAACAVSDCRLLTAVGFGQN